MDLIWPVALARAWSWGIPLNVCYLWVYLQAALIHFDAQFYSLIYSENRSWPHGNFIVVFEVLNMMGSCMQNRTDEQAFDLWWWNFFLEQCYIDPQSRYDREKPHYISSWSCHPLINLSSNFQCYWQIQNQCFIPGGQIPRFGDVFRWGLDPHHSCFWICFHTCTDSC